MARAGLSRSSDVVLLGGFLDLAGGVSGAESESGGDPGAENGESGGEPGSESGGDPGGDSGSLSSSPVTRLVAELRRDEPKLNICDAAAGGLAALAGALDGSISPPKPPNSFPVTDSAACVAAAGGFAASVRPPRLMPPKPPKKLDSCLALDGDCWGLDLCWTGRPVLGSVLGEGPGERAPGEEGPGDFCLGVVGGVNP